MDLSSPDFQSAVKEKEIAHQLSRPSLSYWQDAWRRLKKDRRTLLSLYGVIGILLFTVAGPWVWSVDPAQQDLTMLSKGPAFSGEILVVDPIVQWDLEALVIQNPPAGDFSADSRTTKLEVVGNPTTQAIRLRWDPVPGAASYQIYRSHGSAPDNMATLGVPLGETDDGGAVHYEDRLDLKHIVYYYSVVAVGDFGEADAYVMVEAETQQALLREEAIKRFPGAKAGDMIPVPVHPLGTDYLGRDLLARLMFGARVSLLIGIVSPLLYVLIGTIFGGIAGYMGGKVDQWMMRISDFVVALPFLLMMINIRIAFGIGPGESGIFPLLLALVILSWPATARLVRGQILQLREEAYISAAKLLGAKPLYLITRHMIPNTMGVLLVSITFAVPGAIFTEAFLSFIGMGVVPPTPSWGSMCNEGIKTMLDTPHELIFPSVFICITVLAFNLLGDGLRDALDAKMRSRE